jgi:hypothetical protein
MRLTLTVSRRAPPHQARAEAYPTGVTREVSSIEIPGEVALAVIEAEATKLFEANGCLVITIQRAPQEPPR